jgi:hypothetical protein
MFSVTKRKKNYIFVEKKMIYYEIERIGQSPLLLKKMKNEKF